jgi:hypothetical protein
VLRSEMHRRNSIPLALALLLFIAVKSRAQYVAPPSDQREGSLSISFQNYYNRVNGRTIYNAQGGGVRLRRFYSRLGLLTGQFEPLVSNGKLSFGDNYLSLTGVPWQGRHWDLYGGEFRAESSLVENPFQNYQLPQIGLRGGRVIARTDNWTASTFAGQQSFAQGSRVSFRRTAPQALIGGTAAGTIRKNIQLGFRVLQMNSSRANAESNASFFPLGRRIISSTSATAQSTIKLNKKVRAYGEASLNRSKMGVESAVKPSRMSWVVGQSYEGDNIRLRGNYVHQGIGYLPAAGYYLGDRRGPSVDGSYQIGPIGLSGTWLQSNNNVEGDATASTFFSRQGGGNVYAHLPWRFSVSGSANHIGLRSSHPEEGITNHRQRQYLAALGRPVYRHNLRFAWIRTEQRMFGTQQQINSMEFEDAFNWRNFSSSAAVRLQTVEGDETKDSYFTRASVQWARGRLNIYGNWEQGRDLANETLFTTSVASTSVVGMTWTALSGMAVRLEGFRTQNNTSLNPQNLFLLSTRGMVPDTVVNRTNDWNIYLRVSREMGWGSHIFDGGPGGIAAQAPLIGSIAGYVRLRTMNGDLPAANVWVTADTGVQAKTDSHGYFAIPEIFQGKRSLKLDEDRLPADFTPMGPTELLIDVKADQTARAELTVSPLVYFEGVVKDQEGTPAPEGIILELQPGSTQTTTDEKGRFGFYSLAEGEYEVDLISSALPDETPITYPTHTRVSLFHGKHAEAIDLRIEVERQGPKAVKEINLGAESKSVKIKMPTEQQGAAKATKQNGRFRPLPRGTASLAPKPAPSMLSQRRVVTSTAPSSRTKHAPAAGPKPVKKLEKTSAELVAAKSTTRPSDDGEGGRRLLVKSTR